MPRAGSGAPRSAANDTLKQAGKSSRELDVVVQVAVSGGLLAVFVAGGFG